MTKGELMSGWFSTKKSISVVHHDNRLKKEKSHDQYKKAI